MDRIISNDPGRMDTGLAPATGKHRQLFFLRLSSISLGTA